MKLIKSLLLVSVAAILASCNLVEPNNPVLGKYTDTPVEVNVEVAGTAVKAGYEEGALQEGSIGLYMYTPKYDQSAYNAYNRRVTFTEGTWAVSGEALCWANDDAEVEYFAYAPYSSMIGNMIPSGYQIDVPTAQTESKIKDADFLYMGWNKTTAAESKGQLDVELAHQLSKLVVKFEKNANIVINEVKLQNCVTRGYFDFYNGVWNQVSEIGVNEISMYNNGTAFEAILIPQSMVLTVVIEAVVNGVESTYSYIAESSHSLLPGTRYTLPLSLSLEERVAVQIGDIVVEAWDKVVLDAGVAEEIPLEEQVLPVCSLARAMVNMEDGALLASVGGYVQGIVTANNQGGNLYKGLSVVDGTAEPLSGIYLYDINVNEGFNIGDVVKIRLANAKLRIYNGLREVVWDAYDNEIEVVGSVGSWDTPIISAEDLSNGHYMGMYVALYAKCAEYGNITWVDEGATNTNIMFSDLYYGGEFIVRTSKYATWASDYINTEAENLIAGVALHYGTEGQLYPASYNDIANFYKEPSIDGLYESTDYSQDGIVTVLQKATVGNGIDIVVMGDAYTDNLIADGTYRTAMEESIEYFFADEPYKSYKDYFNIYMVNVVSRHGEYVDGAETRLSTWFEGGNSTGVGGDDQLVFEYALQAISEERLDEATIVVLMNRDYYAGTCWMYYPNAYVNGLPGDETCNFGNGPSIAYFPTSSDKATFRGLMLHETGGHGFAKLADEYWYEANGTISSGVVNDVKNFWQYGWYTNVCFTSDPSAVNWAHFLADERYDGQGLGVFEGGYTYFKGVYRSTEYSNMVYNEGGFNAPCREAIYKRLNKLAYGTDWTYDYEEFVSYDAINAQNASAVQQSAVGHGVLKPNTPPVVVGKTWRQVMAEKKGVASVKADKIKTTR